MASRTVFLHVVIGFALLGSVASTAAQEVPDVSQPDVSQDVAEAASQEAPSIEHSSSGCVPANGFPKFTAKILGDLQNVRVYFRSNISQDFYFVEMAKVAGQWEGVIPKPENPPTESVSYYIEAVDKSSNVTRTEDFSPRVSDTCDAKQYDGKEAPSITVGATEAGVATVPAGFSAEGITGFVNLAAAGSEQIAAGAGLGAKAIAGLVGAAAAGTTLVTVAATGDESPSTPQSNPQNPQ